MSEFESGREQEIKKEMIKKFLDIVSTIEKYGREHSLGATSASLISDHVRSEEQSSSLTRPSSLVDRRANATQLALAASKDAENIGLSLDFVHDKGSKIFGAKDPVDGGDLGTSELRINVSDVNKLSNFLKLLTSDDLDGAPELKEGLGQVIQILTKQMVDAYDKETNEGNNLLKNIGAILPHFIRLGVQEQDDAIYQYMANSKNRTLGEYITLKNAQCFDTPEDQVFGPSKWHLDMSVDRYEEKWNKTEQAVISSLRNSKAGILSTEAIDNLINCAGKAIDDCESKIRENDEHYAQKAPEFIEIAKKYRANFESIRERIKLGGQKKMLS